MRTVEVEAGTLRRLAIELDTLVLDVEVVATNPKTVSELLDIVHELESLARPKC